MIRVTRVLALTTFLILSPLVRADTLVVIVNTENSTNSMTKNQLIDVFMGKYVAFDNGSRAQPLDNIDPSEVKTQFYQKLVGLSLARVNAYWSRIKFTGRARPPLELDSNETVINYVTENTNAIGYIPKSQASSQVKIIYTFEN
ncbi:hypothetical protein [Pleionea sediminis]|uniref:hypothetical protein n=1 Tax=Pleionea sediminis TaxID=2569479 RepID=UPI0011864D5B|nr:hypothetical protein [Pleionea sediminis]